MNQSNLKKLQNLLKEKDTDIFVINRSDEYLNEYISPNAERLNFITNFSGSAGRAIITCLLYTSPSPRDLSTSRMPSSA